LRLQPRITLSIHIGRVCVLSAIDFDNQPRIQAREINDVFSDRHLLAKAMTIDLLSPKQKPQGALRVRHLLSKAASILFQHRVCGTPLPNLPPQGGKGSP
jgi:hypothetical protein